MSIIPPTLIGIQLEEGEQIVLGRARNEEHEAKAEEEEEVEEEEEAEAKEEEDPEEDPEEDHKEDLEEELEGGQANRDPTIPWLDEMWTEQEDDPHGIIHCIEERRAQRDCDNIAVMEFDAMSPSLPVVNVDTDEEARDNCMWKTVYE